MWNVQTFTELPSTQTLAREKLAAGIARHGDVFVALHQSDGRGQYEHRMWYDEPGANLLMSIVLTEVNMQTIDLMQFTTGLSVLATLRSILVQRIRSFAPERVRLKWPNDILIDGRKVSGILCEAIWSGTTLKGIVLGIGINVNQESFAEPVAVSATSLRNVLGDPFALEEARDILLATLQFTLKRYADRPILVADLQQEFEWMTQLEDVSATLNDGSILEGITIRGVNERGALHISTANGVVLDLNGATLRIPL